MRRFSRAVVLAAVALVSCRIDVTGAPCSVDESCPAGQRCDLATNRCVVGEGSQAGGSSSSAGGAAVIAGGRTGGGLANGGGGSSAAGGSSSAGGSTTAGGSAVGGGSAAGGSATGGGPIAGGLGGGSTTGCQSTPECEALLAAATVSPAGCAEATCNLSTGLCEFRARDLDNDGERAASCTAGALVVTRGPDCDDSNATVKAGAMVPCFTSEDGGALFPSTPPKGECVAPTKTCDATGSGQFSTCSGGVLPTAVQCSSTRDFNCNERPDSEECGCQVGTTRSCFPADAGRPGVGRCMNGVETCAEVDAGLSLWGACVGAVIAANETCNNVDDDCDTVVDDAPGVGSLCPASGQVCSAGSCNCTAGNTVCGPACVANACTVGVGACRRTGALVCTGADAGCSVVPGAPATEVPCNGIDEDCNGADSITCPATGQACTNGTCQCPVGQSVCNGACRAYGSTCSVGTGACQRTGTNSVCSGTAFTCSAAAGSPSTEIPCNAVDEDCNGVASQSCSTPGQVCTAGSCQCPSGQQVCGGACASYGTGCTVGTGACQRSGANTVCNGSSYTCNVSPGAPGREVECNGVDEDCNGSAAGACSQGGADDGTNCVQRRYPLDIPDQWYGDWAEGGQSFFIGTMPSFTGATRVDLYFRVLRPGSGNGSCCGTNSSLLVASIVCNGSTVLNLYESDFPTGGVQRMVSTSPGASCSMVFYNNGNTCCCGCNRIFDSWDAYAVGPRCRTL